MRALYAKILQINVVNLPEFLYLGFYIIIILYYYNNIIIYK